MNPLRAADWLSLAAAPVFALMALLTTYFGDGHAGLYVPRRASPSI